MIRFGIICCDGELAAWQVQTIEALRETGDISFALIAIEKRIAVSKKRGIRAVFPFRQYSMLWNSYLSFYIKRRSHSSAPVVAEAQFRNVPLHDCTGESSRRFSDEDIAVIRSSNLHFMLDFGAGEMSKDVLHIPQYGVWSFVQGRDIQCGHNLSCFWAVHRDEPVISVTLQQIRDGGAQGTVLREGYFQNFKHSYLRSLDNIQLGVTQWPAEVCRDIQRDDTSCFHSPMTTSLSLPTNPTNLQTTHFALRLAWRFMRKVWIALFFRYTWNVGIVAAPIEIFLHRDARPPVQWLPRPPQDRFLADPFAFTRDTLFVEEFDQRTQKGHIAVLTLQSDGSYSTPQPVIELPLHMSYPYLLKYQGDIYCVPEIGQEGKVSIYKSVEFPLKWTRIATLIDGFTGLDSTIFEYNGRWWLFCSEGGRFGNNNLHAWYAPDLFGPWIPHVHNPIKTDIRSSRPAGTPFIKDGQLYRPAQDCSQTYGGAVVINRIVQLSPLAFEEHLVSIVEPYKDVLYHHGLHTLSAVGQHTFIDGKAKSFAPTELLNLRHTRISKLWRR